MTTKNRTQMTFQLTDFLLLDVIPKLEEGMTEGIFLTEDDCDKLIKVLSISISIEPFITIIADLPKKTIMAIHREAKAHETPDSERNGSKVN